MMRARDRVYILSNKPRLSHDVELLIWSPWSHTVMKDWVSIKAHEISSAFSK